MPRLFEPGADTLARLVLVGLVAGPLAAFGLAYFSQISPWIRGTNVTVEQPVPFSHKHHVGEVGLDCRFCHATVETNRFAGIPSTQVCMTCHSQLFTTAGMLAPVRDSLAHDVPLRWVRVNNLPGYVYFELDQSAPDWRDFATAPALGLHVASLWPDLKLEFWCVKRTDR